MGVEELVFEHARECAFNQMCVCVCKCLCQCVYVLSVRVSCSFFSSSVGSWTLQPYKDIAQVILRFYFAFKISLLKLKQTSFYLLLSAATAELKLRGVIWRNEREIHNNMNHRIEYNRICFIVIALECK